MRVDRGRVDAGEARSRSESARDDLSLATSFSTALRRFQSRERSTQARRSDESPSRDNNRTTDRSDGARSRTTVPLCELIEGVSSDAVLSLPASFSVLPQSIDIKTEAVAQTATTKDVRRRRAVPDDETSPCIEIEHAASGLRCVLSHQDGIWLLSVTQSPASDEDARALIDNLRAHFQTHGLGAIDIVA